MALLPVLSVLYVYMQDRTTLRRKLNPLQKSNLICTYGTAKSDRLDKLRHASFPLASTRQGSRCYPSRKTEPASRVWHGIQSNSSFDAQNDLTLDWFANLDAAQYVLALSFIPGFADDFSSLSPLRLLSELGGEAADENSAAALLATIWQKIRQSTDGNHSPSNIVNDDTVPPYAHESTTYFIKVGMEKRQKSFDATICDSPSWKYFERALQCRRAVSTGPSSLLKLQASD
ncbi:MAG: hypothetical protein Q9176_006055 [Flavoplaca citrina]